MSPKIADPKTEKKVNNKISLQKNKKSESPEENKNKGNSKTLSDNKNSAEEVKAEKNEVQTTSENTVEKEEKPKKEKKKFKFSLAKFISFVMAFSIIGYVGVQAFVYLFDYGGKNSIFGPDSNGLSGKVICLDAGAGVHTNNKMEQPFLGSSDFVSAYSGGAKNDNITEEELNLKIVNMLKAKLEEAGVKVYLTRDTKFSNITNIDKAEFANTIGADLLLQIFCGESDNKEAEGIGISVPSPVHCEKGVAEASTNIGEALLRDMVLNTKAQNLGVMGKTDYTEFNWIRVPVTRVVLGYLSNEKESAKLITPEYQEKLVDGIFDGLSRYFSE